VSFFEAPHPPPEPTERPAAPAWLDPPDNVIGVGVPLNVVLARTDDVALAIPGATAYAAGFVVELAVRRRTWDPGLCIPTASSFLPAFSPHRFWRGRNSACCSAVRNAFLGWL